MHCMHFSLSLSSSLLKKGRITDGVTVFRCTKSSGHAKASLFRKSIQLKSAIQKRGTRNPKLSCTTLVSRSGEEG